MRRLFTLLIVAFFLVVPSSKVLADSIYSGFDFTPSFPSGFDTDLISYPAFQTLPQGDAPVGETIYGVEIYVKEVGTGDRWAKGSFITSTTTIPIACEQVSMPSATGIQYVALPTPVVVPYGTEAFNFSPVYSNSDCTTPAGPTWVYYTLDDGIQGADARWRIVYFDPNGSTATRITAVEPADEEVVATTSVLTLGASGYVSNDDDGIDLVFKWTITKVGSGCLDVICIFDGFNNRQVIYEEFSYQSPPDGHNFVISTTTPAFDEGLYEMTAQIVRPKTLFGLTGVLGITFGDEVLAEWNTTFTSGTTTLLDTIIGGIRDTQFTSTTTQAAFESCNPLSFSLSNCLAVLFFPDKAQMTRVFEQARGSFLSVVPFGYVTKFFEAISSTATTSLPVLSYTFTEDSVFGSTTLAFNFGEIMDDSSNLINNELLSKGDNPQSVWDIIMPTFNIIIYLLLAIMIVRDLTGVHSHHSESTRREAT